MERTADLYGSALKLPLLDHVDHCQLSRMDQGRCGNYCQFFRLHGDQQPSEHTRNNIFCVVQTHTNGHGAAGRIGRWNDFHYLALHFFLYCINPERKQCIQPQCDQSVLRERWPQAKTTLLDMVNSGLLAPQDLLHWHSVRTILYRGSDYGHTTGLLQPLCSCSIWQDWPRVFRLVWCVKVVGAMTC